MRDGKVHEVSVCVLVIQLGFSQMLIKMTIDKSNTQSRNHNGQCFFVEMRIHYLTPLQHHLEKENVETFHLSLTWQTHRRSKYK